MLLKKRHQLNEMPEQVKPSDIFEDIESQIRDVIDPDAENIVNIDIESIGHESEIDALDLIRNISKLYFNEEFIKSQPNWKHRVDNELESLRINLKMRKADEVAHDLLLKNIGQSPSNASMYRSLTELQKTIVSITTKIDDTIKHLNDMMKSYQLELNFEPEPSSTDDGKPATVGKTFKGSKAFIESMGSAEDDDIDIPEDEDD